MADVSEDENLGVVTTRPSVGQVKVLIDYMESHPELYKGNHNFGKRNIKFNKSWSVIAETMNQMDGARKSTKGWIKFWSDKKRFIKIKLKQIKDGKMNQEALTEMEQRIMEFCYEEKKAPKKRKKIKEEPYNGNDEEEVSLDEYPSDITEFCQPTALPTEADERHINIMEKLVEVMDQQASAMTQMAQATLSNAQALERIAEAANIQALAVDRLSNTFENITAAVHDVRNAIMGIDYTMKRCYPPPPQLRQNSNIFN